VRQENSSVPGKAKGPGRETGALSNTLCEMT
jgi:hypothetical protein